MTNRQIQIFFVYTKRFTCYDANAEIPCLMVVNTVILILSLLCSLLTPEGNGNFIRLSTGY